MIPRLYARDEMNFTHNGIGLLSDTLSATITEELNSTSELQLEYDVDGQFADQIDDGMIIKAKANDKQDDQLFRIYKHVKDQADNKITVYAQHITYDLAQNFVETLELSGVTTAKAMQTIQSNLAYSTRFTLSSDNTTTISSTKLYRNNPLQMIAGIDGSILDNWGGEIERNNFSLIMRARRGTDDGVLVAYRKNLTGLIVTVDRSNLVTRIYPFKTLDDGTVLTIPGKYVDSPHINDYDHVYIQAVDYGSDEDVTDQASLESKSAQWFTLNSGRDKPTITMDVTFEPLWATEEYKMVKMLELVGMGDTIYIKNNHLGIDGSARIVKIVYDVLAEKNAQVTAGDVKTSLEDKVNAISSVNTKADAALILAGSAIANADGTTTIYSATEPVGNYKVGSLWFKLIDGTYTQMYRYDGIQWVLIKSQDANDALNKAIDALTSANGKNAVYHQAAQPIAGNNGDIWFRNNADGTITQFIYQSGHWINPLDDGVKAAQDQAANAVNTAGSALTQAQTAINTANNAASVANDASQSVVTLTQTVNGLSTQVSNKVEMTTFNSYTAQTANTIATLLTKTDAAGTYATQSALTQTSGSLTSQITAVQTNLNKLQIGGTNLIQNSSFESNLDGWTVVGNVSIDTSLQHAWFDATALPSSQFVRVYRMLDYDIEPNTNYTYSIYNRGGSFRLYAVERKSDGSYVNPFKDNSHDFTASGLCSFTFTTSGDTRKLQVYITVYGGSGASLRHAKLEKGDKATDWSPALEDMVSQSQITQLSDDINLRVQKNDVINQINISTESILIAGQKVHITGQTTIDNAVIQSAMINALDAGKITTGTLNANRIAAGTITSDKLSVSSLSAISANLGTVTAGTINGVTINGSTLNYSNGYLNSSGVEFNFSRVKAEFGDFGDNFYGLRVTDNEDGSYAELSTSMGQSHVIGMVVHKNALLQITDNELSINQNNKWGSLKFNGDGFDIGVTSSKFWRIGVHEGQVYLGNDVPVIVTSSLKFGDVQLNHNNKDGLDISTGNNGWSVGFGIEGNIHKAIFRQDIRADSGWVYSGNFVNSSREELKTEITALDDNIGLSLVNSIDIYKFKYKKDVEYGRAKYIYGGIIGDEYNVPDDFMDFDHNGMNLYTSTFVGLKAIQELSSLHQEDVLKIANLETIIASQQQQINDLMQQNNDLRDRVQLLEAA